MNERGRNGGRGRGCQSCYIFFEDEIHTLETKTAEFQNTTMTCTDKHNMQKKRGREPKTAGYLCSCFDKINIHLSGQVDTGAEWESHGNSAVRLSAKMRVSNQTAHIQILSKERVGTRLNCPHDGKTTKDSVFTI